jgi:hypothetical protein
MHRVTEEWAHRKCGWKHSAKDEDRWARPPRGRHVGLDRMCLLMEDGVTAASASPTSTNPPTTSAGLLVVAREQHAARRQHAGAEQRAALSG